MNAVGGDLGGGRRLGQVDRLHDLGELRLRVGADARVATRDHRVVEVDRVLAERGDVDDPCRGAAAQQRQQALGEQKAGEIVDRESQFVPVEALLTLPAIGQAGADPGVVDQHVQLLHRGLDGLRQPPDLVQRREVGQVELDPVAPWRSRISATTSSPRSASRPWTRTFAPRPASAIATLRPSPSVAPVTSAVVASIGLRESTWTANPRRRPARERPPARARSPAPRRSRAPGGISSGRGPPRGRRRDRRGCAPGGRRR